MQVIRSSRINMSRRQLDWYYGFWLFGIEVYTAWNMPDMAVEAHSNAIGFGSLNYE